MWIRILIQIAIVGLISWAINYLLPIPEKIKTIIYVVAVLICLLMVANGFGVDTGVKVP